MKAFNMATEPVSGFAAGFVIKAIIAAGIGICGAALMAAFDPPNSRKELFLQAAVAGTGSLVFGDFASMALLHYLPWAVGHSTIPCYFLVGALSWGVFGAVAKFRALVAEKAAAALAKKFGVDE